MTIAQHPSSTLAPTTLLVAAGSCSAVGDGDAGGQVTITLLVLGCSAGAETVNVELGWQSVDALLHGLLGADGALQTSKRNLNSKYKNFHMNTWLGPSSMVLLQWRVYTCYQECQDNPEMLMKRDITIK